MSIQTSQPRRAPGDKPSPRHRRNGGNYFGTVAPRADATTDPNGNTDPETDANQDAPATLPSIPRTDATAAPGSGNTSTHATSAQTVQDMPTGDEPRGIEPARLVSFLARATVAGGALLIGAAGALGAIPPHRWPRVTLALAYLTAAGLTALIGAGLSWAALRRPDTTRAAQ